MSETENLGLPLLAESQNDKHVTVNTSLTRLDSLFMLSVRSRVIDTPPASPAEGDRYIVAAGAIDEWNQQSPNLAMYVNGEWDFVVPLTGWRCWVEDEQIEVVYDNGAWSPLIVTQPAFTGIVHTVSALHAPSGVQSDTAMTVPAGSVVFGVTARVQDAISGVTGWSLGVPEAETRYGSGHGIAKNATVTGPTGAPLAYPAAVPLRLTAEGGSFGGGSVELMIHYMTLDVPVPA